MSPTAQLSIRLGLIGLVTVVLQTAMLSQLSILGGVPDIAPLVVASVGLLSGVVGGAVTGFWIGLLVDVATMQTLGVSSFTYIVVGYFAGGVLVGVVGFGAPAKLVRYRAMIAEGAARDAVLAQSDAATAVGG